MNRYSALILSIILIVSVGAMSTAVGGAVTEQLTTTEAVSTASVTKTVSINTSGGTQGSDRLRAIETTSDGGYIAAGKLKVNSKADIWVVKFDSTGQVVWNKTYAVQGQEGGFFSPTDGAFDILETDSGYLVAGKNADSAGLLKIDDQGNEQWNKSYSDAKVLKSVVETSNGDYVAAGVADSSQGDNQAFLIRVNSQGVKQWSNTYGGVKSSADDNQLDNAKEVVTSGNGGFVFVGSTESYGAGSSDRNTWVVKTNDQGVEQWNKSLGDSGDGEEGRSLAAAQNGGYVILGDQQPEFLGYKLNEQGSVQWRKTYLKSDSGAHSGKSYLATDITRTNNGNYLLIGEEVFEDFNAVAVKIANDGTAQWNTSFPDNLGSEFSSTKFLDVEQTSDGDFIFGGYSEDFGPGTKAAMVMKIGFSAEGTTGGDEDTTGDGGNDSTTTSDPVQLSVQNATGSANETVTVQFNFTNTNGTSLSGPAVKVIDYPSNWTLSSHSDAGSTYSESSGTPTWLWLSISAGTSKQPTMTFQVPNSTQPGEYTVTGQAKTANNFIVNDSATVTISKSGAKTITEEIAGSDNTIGISEIQRAIRLWAANKPVPNTNGKTIGIVKIQELIQQWASGG